MNALNLYQWNNMSYLGILTAFNVFFHFPDYHIERDTIMGKLCQVSTKLLVSHTTVTRGTGIIFLVYILQQHKGIQSIINNMRDYLKDNQWSLCRFLVSFLHLFYELLGKKKNNNNNTGAFSPLLPQAFWKSLPLTPWGNRSTTSRSLLPHWRC